MSDNYIAPNTNIGILYPNWVTYNYKKYKVKKTPFDPNIDLCKLQKKTKWCNETSTLSGIFTKIHEI